MDVGTTATTNVAQPSVEAPSASAASATATAGSGSSYSAQSTAQPTDLLPQDHNEQWASINPRAKTHPTPLIY